MKLTLIGNGIMAQSLAIGLVKKYEVEMIGREYEKLKLIKQKIPKIEIKELEDKEDISGKNIIMCVKPYALESVSVRLNGEANSLISILAGTKLDYLRKLIKAKNYVRSMPNVAASVQNSMTALTGDIALKDITTDIFKTIGEAVWVNSETHLDIASAVCGSGPAFLALVAEAIADGAVKVGLERNLAHLMVQGLFSSSASLLKHSHPAIIKDSVMSPAGTTAAGYAKLEEGNVRDAFIKAIEGSFKKSKKIAEK
ncbi:Pyrroline-5-carboxylate reductase [Aliarcobacter thereius]|uniref:Pyrroline-5-carboxylate reductase n=2 Tax=Aliarcobacter thereius TaxID=544718 RepID=A0A1C0B5X3_9BACT|nr:pyrroline-5-carboxylate reductase [Aliarcobacter thereius]OCL85763.1 Pyrroline-5-carboxylate reductase [Aliarcobacter thereius]OCL89807.1 Pyrroline-5-carboxylate reductase [Aliarcobacter thereius]OCL96457.1 Pyrroline-5-carboxylate reductase [Aliarcobacter thereius LMG 24486]OCL98583.1 Pyrroline-5-carboxylate reductase [Aliarcobacter thereius]QBF15582.1 pyrroline-5-carboxylate reductase [Aliarcobacter thereius LMG 24486]